MKALLRASVAGLMSTFLLSLSGTASAEGEPCYNDDDCPGGGAVCGGDVCNWAKMSATPSGDKVFYCNPAGTDAKGSDGWCTDDSDCKCKAQGAKCFAPYCSFTKATDAPPSSGGTGGSGSSGAGAGGVPTSGGSAAGGTNTSGGAGSGTTAGTGPSLAGASSGGGSTTPPPAPAPESGGCSVSGPTRTSGGGLLALGAAGLGLAFARRRR